MLNKNNKAITILSMSFILTAAGMPSVLCSTGTSTAASKTVTAKASSNQPQKPPTGNPPSGGNGFAPSGNGQPGQPGQGSQSSNIKATASYTLSGKTATLKNKTIRSSTKDQSGILVSNSGTLNISGSSINKTGNNSSDDSSNFYGINAGVLANSKGKINISGCTIKTNSSGSNAVFATGAGSSINISNSKIETSGDSSRGLDATMTGKVTATNVDIKTAGTHCAGLATDRGCGTISATGGTIITSGVDSPGIYSTGTISAKNSEIKALGSEAAVVEGKNSITLTNVSLSGTKKRGVMMYQSFSGDAETGTSSFSMTGGSLKAAAGPLFYITNTDAVISLKGVKTSEASGTLLAASADNWGNKGSNGGKVTLNSDNQNLNGNVTCDSISSISINLKNSSTLKGMINNSNSGKSIALSLDKTSKWTVTGNSYLTSLTDQDTKLTNINDNGYTIYYSSTSTANKWLGCKTYTLSHGGKLAPVSPTAK